MAAPHGTRSRYVQQRCRCGECREANRLYYHELQARRRAAVEALDPPKRRRKTCPGPPGAGRCPHESRLRKDSLGGLCARCRVVVGAPERVDPTRAAEHLRQLGERGVGYKQAASAAGLGKTAVAKILSGETRWIHPETERRILEVDVDAMAAGVRVPATQAVEDFREVLSLGLKKVDVAAALGTSPGNISKLGRARFVTLRTQRRLEELLFETRREAARDRGARCGICRNEPGSVCGHGRGFDLDLVDPLTFDEARAVFPGVYTDTALARRRFRDDVRRLRRRR